MAGWFGALSKTRSIIQKVFTPAADAAGDLDAINSVLVQMAIDYADSNARYVAAYAVI